MEPRRAFFLPFIAILVFGMCIEATAQGVSSDLMDLAHIKSGVKSKRISSYDKTGGNNDRFENIPDGETRTLFEVEGAGVINHIWITIAPPPRI